MIKEFIGFFTGSCLMLVFALAINLAFWGSLVWFILHMLQKYGVL